MSAFTEDITFRALTEEKEMNVNELFNAYNTREQCHLRPYLHITQNSLHNHPVIYDSKGVVCSLPPIINGEHSKITLNTKNVFIECTGTDLTKLKVTLNIVVSSSTSTEFSREILQTSLGVTL
jgi:phenylalanyl-tRNA synthetase beta chain